VKGVLTGHPSQPGPSRAVVDVDNRAEVRQFLISRRARLCRERPHSRTATHRAAMPHDAAQHMLAAEVTAGRLDGDAVRAVLVAGGHRVRRQADQVGGLTAREVEVLVLLARGRTMRQIAQALTARRFAQLGDAHVSIPSRTRSKTAGKGTRYAEPPRS
jgi:hypothetical protein